MHFPAAVPAAALPKMPPTTGAMFPKSRYCIVILGTCTPPLGNSAPGRTIHGTSQPRSTVLPYRHIPTNIITSHVTQHLRLISINNKQSRDPTAATTAVNRSFRLPAAAPVPPRNLPGHSAVAGPARWPPGPPVSAARPVPTRDLPGRSAAAGPARRPPGPPGICRFRRRRPRICRARPVSADPAAAAPESAEPARYLPARYI